MLTSADYPFPDKLLSYYPVDHIGTSFAAIFCLIGLLRWMKYKQQSYIKTERMHFNSSSLIPNRHCRHSNQLHLAGAFLSIQYHSGISATASRNSRGCLIYIVLTPYIIKRISKYTLTLTTYSLFG